MGNTLAGHVGKIWVGQSRDSRRLLALLSAVMGVAQFLLAACAIAQGALTITIDGHRIKPRIVVAPGASIWNLTVSQTQGAWKTIDRKEVVVRKTDRTRGWKPATLVRSPPPSNYLAFGPDGEVYTQGCTAERVTEGQARFLRLAANGVEDVTAQLWGNLAVPCYSTFAIDYSGNFLALTTEGIMKTGFRQRPRLLLPMASLSKVADTQGGILDNFVVVGAALDGTVYFKAYTLPRDTNRAMFRLTPAGKVVPVLDADFGHEIVNFFDAAVSPSGDLFVSVAFGNPIGGDQPYGYGLIRVDAKSNVEILLRDIESHSLDELAFDADGTLYAIASAHGLFSARQDWVLEYRLPRR